MVSKIRKDQNVQKGVTDQRVDGILRAMRRHGKNKIKRSFKGGIQ